MKNMENIKKLLEKSDINKKEKITYDISKIIKIQSFIRMWIYKKNNLPNSIKNIQKNLKNKNIECSYLTDDGRTNSCIDEKNILNYLKDEYKERIWIPNGKSRHWYDVCILL